MLVALGISIIASGPVGVAAQDSFPPPGDALIPRPSRQHAARFSGEVEQRIDAARQLAWHEGDPSLRVLLSALERERVPSVQEAILRSLIVRADELRELLQQPGGPPGSATERPDIDYRRLVQRGWTGFALMGRLADAESERRLIDALGGASPDRAVEALVRMGPSVISDDLRERVDHPYGVYPMTVLSRLRDRASMDRFSLDRDAQFATAAAEGLMELGATEAAPRLRRALGEAYPEATHRAALHALGRLGGEEDIDLLRTWSTSGELAVRRVAMESLCLLSPRAGAEVLAASLASEDPHLVRAAADVALDQRHPSFLAVLYGLLREGTRASEAASTLAEVNAGAGLSVLLREVLRPELAPDLRGRLQLAIAVSVRRFRDALPRATLRLAEEALRDIDVAPRRWILRALSGDTAIASRLVDRALNPRLSAQERAWAAYARELLGTRLSRRDFRRLGEHLRSVTDDEVFRRVASLLVADGRALSPDWVAPRFLQSPETAPEATLAYARSFEALRPRQQRLFRQKLRRWLRSPSGRLQAAAVRVLGELRDEAAWRSLCVAFESAEPVVRVAIARALTRIADPESLAVVTALWWLEEDAAVLRSLDATLESLRRAAAEPPDTGRRSASAWSYAAGEQVLRARVTITNGEARTNGEMRDGEQAGDSAEQGRGWNGSAAMADITLPDGRIVRMRSAPGGEFVIANLPLGTADLRLNLDSP